MSTREPPTIEVMLPEIYEELRAMARSLHHRHRAGDEIRPTSLVHEAFLRLSRSDPDINDPVHAAALAARAMRNVLIDHVRRTSASRRGGGWDRITLSGIGAPDTTVDLLALDQALDALAEIDPRGAEVVQLRFFGGLENAEIAQLQGVSSRTVERDWRAARAWLATTLAESA